MKNLYIGSYKILLKELKTQYIERSQAHGLEDLIMLRFTTTKSKLQIQYNPYKSHNGIFCRERKTYPTIIISKDLK